MNLHQIALQNLRRRKSKSLFILLGIVIAVAAVTSIYTVVDSMQQALTRQMQEYGANVVITPKRGEMAFSYGGIAVPEVLFSQEVLSHEDLAIMDGLAAGGDIRAVAPKTLGTVETTGGQSLVLAGIRLEEEMTLKPWLEVEGHKNDTEGGSYMPLAGDEVLLGAALARELGLHKGDILEMNGAEFLVAGIFAENGSSEDNQVFMDLEAAQHVLDRPGQLSLIELGVEYSQGGEEALLAELQRSLPGAQVISLRQTMLRQDEVLGRLARFGFALSIIILLAGTFLAAVTLLGAVLERTREFGIFRAIGFRRSHIMKMVLLEGVLLSSTGGFLGYVLGILGSRRLGPLVTGMELYMPWSLSLLLASLFLSVLIGLGASYYPARRGADMDVAQALRSL